MPGTLFVTRKFPPSVGGMETLAADVWATLSDGEEGSAALVAHRGRNRGLPWFLLRATVATVRGVRGGRVDVVLTGDVLMYLVLAPVARLLGVRIATMAMGKDVVWRQPLYQWLVRRRLPRADKVLAISAATAAEVVGVGCPPDRVRVVRLGVEVPSVTAEGRAAARASLRRRLGVDQNAVVLAALGRLVPRKGVAWFLREVVPGLPAAVVVVVAGDGEDLPAVRRAAVALPDHARVRLLGLVDDALREEVMQGCDVFVQPNVPVAHDMEGFGLVAVEAAARGALVVAADLEGLRDAVAPGQTGILLPPGDAVAWQEALTSLVSDAGSLAVRAEAYAAACRGMYGREQMGRQLRDVLDTDSHTT